MSQVELVDGDEIFNIKSVFLNTKQARTAEIHDAVSFHALNNFTDSIELRTRAVVYQVTHLQVVMGPPVKR